MSKKSNIDIYSEEVHEIMGTPPAWIIRWGITIILVVILVVIAGTYFFKYPDQIPSRITILSEDPPVQIVARATGKIDKLFVENNQRVSADQVLAVIENTANYADACSLLQRLKDISHYFNDPRKLSLIEFDDAYSLGQYHSYLSSFISQLRNYQTFLNYNPQDQRLGTLEKQLEDYERFIKNSEEQIGILKMDYELALSQFHRDSILFAQRMITPADFENSKASMLKQKFSYQNSITSLAGTQIIINNLDQQMREQKILKAETESQLLATLKEKFENLRNQLVDWEQSFVLKTPVPGLITFTRFWSENQYVTTGDNVFTIVPVEKQKIIGRAEAPIAGVGKVEPGQRVNIKLDNFPHLEYGILEGRVATISKVPVNKSEGTYYTVEVVLVNDMITNYGRELHFSQEMQGTAEIITKERRMIQRLIDPIVSKYKERVTPEKQKTE
jgi:HlyD family secretion protein